MTRRTQLNLSQFRQAELEEERKYKGETEVSRTGEEQATAYRTKSRLTHYSTQAEEDEELSLQFTDDEEREFSTDEDALIHACITRYFSAVRGLNR